MKCSNCKTEFCFLCLARWNSPHSFGCPYFVYGCGCCEGSHFCFLLVVLMALLLVPLPLAIGFVVATVFTLAWLPLGLLWAALAQCFGGDWKAFDIVFPLVSCTATFRQSQGAFGAFYVLIFLGTALVVVCGALLLEAIWFPVAAVVFLPQGWDANILFFPLLVAILLLIETDVVTVRSRT
jgi:hypothetical protein